MAPLTPQIPANIREGAQNLGWYQNPALKNMFSGTGFNQPAGDASNPFGSVLANTKALQEIGIDPKPYIGSFIENATLNSMINRPVDLAAQEKLLKMNEESQLRVAHERQKLGEESTQKAILYNALGNIGNNIINANAASLGILSKTDIPSVVNNTMRSFPQPQVSVIAPSPSPQRAYFK
jgi:hypothetical protein